MRVTTGITDKLYQKAHVGIFSPNQHNVLIWKSKHYLRQQAAGFTYILF